MGLPVQPPNMTGISSATATSRGADSINVGGLTFAPPQKGMNDVLIYVALALGAIGVASTMRGRR